MSHIPKKEVEYYDEIKAFVTANKKEAWNMVSNFPNYIDRQRLTKYFARYDIFKQIINVHGSIIECGVWNGGGLMLFAQLCAILEPYNYVRKIIGFDTFEGFPSLKEEDELSRDKKYLSVGQFKCQSFEGLLKAIELFDLNRPIGHVSKVELVKGDAVKTIPEYVKKNPQLIVSLLYLDFDLFEPTKVAIQSFMPLMPKGAVIVFDELSQVRCPGETIAMMQEIGVKNLELKRVPFEPEISYAIIK
ncbi:MAG: class I SAM-dependent methyltransferase [Candidatus Omnitrophica bacterium]|nr:class I SAM-dependent methyltransferase [Candidatus Omnitrophota bacterium]